MTDHKPRVFLSYSHSDHLTVQSIRKILIANGIDIKWDRNFRLADEWTAQLLKELRQAECVLVCWSHESAKSRMVQDEFFGSYLTNKFIGLALQRDIEYPGIADRPNHEAYYEWNDDNREERIANLVAEIKSKANKVNPRVSRKRIGNFVRRIDRKPQKTAVHSAVMDHMSARSPGFVALAASNRFERPDEFAIRVATQLLPVFLKEKSILSDGNDENYEDQVAKIKWPVRYRNPEEAIDCIVREMAAQIPGADPEFTNSVESCIRSAERIASVIYIVLPLHPWDPRNVEVIQNLISEFGKVRFDPARPKYFATLIAAQFDRESECQVVQSSNGFFRNLFRAREDIDEVFTALATKDNCGEFFPRFRKINRADMDEWYEKAEKELKIPEDQKNAVLNEINMPFSSNNSQEEHYQVMADPMQKALVKVFHGDEK
jgi:hypothetical protein